MSETRTPEPGTADPLDLHGIIPPTITVFDENEALDAERTAEHARFVVDNGAHGVFPLGTTGEFPLLTGPERRQVVESVVAEVGSEVPVIAGVGAPSTYETIEHARHAESVGVDGLVVVTPYYYPLDTKAMLDHYERVADAVDLPVYIYQFPDRTGNEISIDTLSKLAEIDAIAGIKDSSQDVSRLERSIDANPELTFLMGADSLVLTGLEIGCAGAVSAVANAVPEAVIGLYDAYMAGDVERAAELQSQVYDVRSAFDAGPHMGGAKTALELRGFPAGPLRSPLRRMDDEQATALEQCLQRHDMCD